MMRNEIFGQLAVFMVMIVSITGSVFVLAVKRGGGRDLMDLVDGAFAGGVIAVCAAVVALVLAAVLRSRTAVAMQGVVSVALALLHLVSMVTVQDRVAAGEPADGWVEFGGLAYLLAGSLQGVAALVGFARLRRLKDPQVTRRSRNSDRAGRR